MTALLETEGLRKRFGGVAAVDGVGFTVSSCERVALIGPNGAGKSTCFNLVGGQLVPDEGRVRLDGREVTGTAPRGLFRLGVGRTFQVAAAFASMSVAENVQLALLSRAGRGLDPFADAASACRSEAHALLARTGLEPLAQRPCGQLAYGDVKRLDLAMALANAPRLLLMDEPTAGMAPAERHALMDLVSGIAREHGLAVLFTEHDMDVVFGHADRILVLDRGRLIAAGDPEAVRADPEVRRLYLGDSVEAAP